MWYFGCSAHQLCCIIYCIQAGGYTNNRGVYREANGERGFAAKVYIALN